MDNNKDLEKKLPRYAIVYDKLLNLIKNGFYKEGSKLPPEPELAQQMGVSRMTLRQSLTMLQEDGLIESIKGRGTFIKKKLEHTFQGLEKKSNPIYNCCSTEIDNVIIEYSVQLSLDYTNYVIKREVPTFLNIERFYMSNNECVAHAHTVLPADIPELNTINLHDKNEVLKFIETKIYDYSNHTSLEIKSGKKDNEITKYANLKSELHLYQIILESVIGSDGQILCFSKYRIPIEKSLIKINCYI